MRSLATWAKGNIKRLRSDLVAITDELAGRIFEEINYLHEGTKCRKNSLNFMVILPKFTSPKSTGNIHGRRVLTMEWVDGTKLTNIKEIQAQGIDATHLVNVGVQCSLRQLLERRIFPCGYPSG
jgi:predicted unusual protein kinase regulating ubiquinone biosynthesis (AarF/ABC1/UbiB family)